MQSDIYAVIDLGSNSFHMLMVKVVAGSVQTIGRVKRKVRLAAGLDEHNHLSLAAMQRGWECLSLFAERLQDIPASNVKIVATATLRLASNAEQFVNTAQQILGNKVNIISGEEEAKTIFLGVAHTSSCQEQQLVIDIGGASTEVVIGKHFTPARYVSLNMGCVTFLERYFPNNDITDEYFANAIVAANSIIAPIVTEFCEYGWQAAVGASGTVQAMQEIMIAQGHDELVTLEKLLAIKELAVVCGHVDSLDLPGLADERRQVFVSGLAILIALFTSLKIQTMTLAGGALREGVMYGMLPQLHCLDIRQRTLDSLQIRYHVDQAQAARVANFAKRLATMVQEPWQLTRNDGIAVLEAAGLVHELGLIVEFKLYHRHSAYLLAKSELPGFTRAQHQLLIALVHNHRLDIDSTMLQKQTMTSVVLAGRLTRLLRLAVLLTMRRQDDILENVQLLVKGDRLTLSLPEGLLATRPLLQAELDQEIRYQKKAGWQFAISSHAG